MSSVNVSSTTSPARRGWLVRKLPAVVPLAVLLGTAGVIGYSAWPVLVPAREVRVVQAVFDRSITPVADDRPEQNQNQNPTRARTVQAAGWLEPEPYYTACAALADGVVERVTVLEGEYVEKGDVVARLVADDAELNLRHAAARLSDARAQLERAEADHTAAKRNWSEPIALRQAVEAGRAALAEAKAQLNRLPALIASAEATLVQLQEEYDRVERLRKSGSSTETEVVVARQLAEAQKADLRAIRALVPVREAQADRLAADLRAAERDLELRIADRQRLDTAGAAVAAARAAVQRAESQRDEAQLALDRMTIRAPISGYVMRRLKGPGDKAVRNMDSEHSAHVVHLYDPEKLQVRVDVPLADASHVSVGQPCEVVVEVLPDRVFRGEVIRSVHRADLQKNTLQFKVRVLDPAPILRPEMLTRVKFLPTQTGSDTGDVPQEANRSRVLVPEAVLDRRGGVTRVWLITDRRTGRGKLRPVTVEPIETRDGWVVVAGPIQPGALVTTDFASATAGETVAIQRTAGPTDEGGDA